MNAGKYIADCTRRRGFTVVEMTFVAGLMSLLLLVISTAWSAMGKPSVDAIRQCHVAQEANIALQSLSRDFGGSIAEHSIGKLELGSYVGSAIVDGSELQLCFDGAPVNGTADWAAPDTVIVYEVQDNQLIRSNSSRGTTITIADDIQEMNLSKQGDQLTIELTFSFRDVRRTYTLIGTNP